MIKIKYVGWAQFLIDASKKISIDPFFKDDVADIILISHSHPDHCDKGAVGIIRSEDTIVVSTEETSKQIDITKVVGPNQKVDLGDVKLETVDSYNLNIPNHPKGSNVGFIIEVDGKRIYHTGDTDFIEEMKNIKDIDVMFVPVGGTFVMDVDQAVKAIKEIKPKIAIPMHYGKITVNFYGKIVDVNLEADLDKFKSEVESETETKVVVLEKNEIYGVE